MILVQLATFANLWFKALFCKVLFITLIWRQEYVLQKAVSKNDHIQWKNSFPVP
jgi:hypothetical protein